jgi:hypothetical protein
VILRVIAMTLCSEWACDDERKELEAKCGAITDAFQHLGSANSSEDLTSLPRFHTTSAQVIMFQYLIGLVEHPPTGEGYEAVVADWFVVWLAAMQSSVRWRRKKPGAKNPEHVTADSHSWLTPRTFLQSIFIELHDRSKAIDATKACRRVQLENKLEIGGSVEEIKTLLNKHASDDLVMVNAPQAEFADVIVYVRSLHRFYLVQVKRTKGLTIHDAKRELGKMQHPKFKKKYLGSKKIRDIPPVDIPCLLRKIDPAGKAADIFFVLVHVSLEEESVQRSATELLPGLPSDVLCVQAQGSPETSKGTGKTSKELGTGKTLFPVAHHVPENITFSVPLKE